MTDQTETPNSDDVEDEITLQDYMDSWQGYDELIKFITEKELWKQLAEWHGADLEPHEFLIVHYLNRMQLKWGLAKLEDAETILSHVADTFGRNDTSWFDKLHISKDDEQHTESSSNHEAD